MCVCSTGGKAMSGSQLGSKESCDKVQSAARCALAELHEAQSMSGNDRCTFTGSGLRYQWKECPALTKSRPSIPSATYTSGQCFTAIYVSAASTLKTRATFCKNVCSNKLLIKLYVELFQKEFCIHVKGI